MDRKIAVQIRYHEHCYETFKIVAESGMKYVSLGFGDQCEWLAKEEWKEEIGHLKTALDEAGLKCIMTHTPYYSLLLSADETDETLDLMMLRCVTATAMLGAEIVAVHPRAYFSAKEHEDVRKSFVYNIKNLLPLVEEAERCGCMIGIENLPTYPGWDVSFFSNFPEEHKRLVDVFHSPNVCAVWDFGHAHLATDNQAEAIEVLGNRIKGTHVHNNFKVIDDHLPPSIGNIDWKCVMEALKNIGFDGYLTTEAVMPWNASLPSYVSHLKECLENLDDMVRAGWESCNECK